jgi:hypothetical protein
MGILLGLYGLRRTRFEDTDEGYYFTPDQRLGVLVGMVLVARIIYLGIEIYLNQGSNQPNPRFSDSPVTMYCLGLTAGYFAAYSAGLMRWRRNRTVRQLSLRTLVSLAVDLHHRSSHKFLLPIHVETRLRHETYA